MCQVGEQGALQGDFRGGFGGVEGRESDLSDT